MERIRRSLRDSFRRSSKDQQFARPDQWQEDDLSVRAGTCSFPVKYLGGVEVFESRGMAVCEEAMKTLRASKRKTIRGILYISGDGLRVVDADNKGLLVDQTIEKVSFCAPDRNHDKGFAYICREGTTRRWMCYGFHALQDSGERLSHAVGCAFAVCLERKNKRDREAQMFVANAPVAAASGSTANTSGQSTVNGSSDGSSPPSANSACSSGAKLANGDSSSFIRKGSFRNLPLIDRLRDPQNVKPSEPPPMKHVVLPHAVARPHSNLSLFQRQGSLRLPCASPVKTTFRRFNSLRLSSGCNSNAYFAPQPLRLEFIKEEESVQYVHPSPQNKLAYSSNDRATVLTPEMNSDRRNGGIFTVAQSDRLNGTAFTAQQVNGQFPSFTESSTPHSPPGWRMPGRTFSRGEEWLNSTTEKIKELHRQRSVDFQDCLKPPPVPPRRTPLVLRSSQSVTSESSRGIDADVLSNNSFSPDVPPRKFLSPFAAGTNSNLNTSAPVAFSAPDPFEVKWNSFRRPAPNGSNPFTDDAESLLV